MFIRELRYVVLKNKDIEKYLTIEQQDQLLQICNTIQLNRNNDNKQPLECVVVEQDWPMYQAIWKLIEDQTNVSRICEEVSLTPKFDENFEPKSLIQSELNEFYSPDTENFLQLLDISDDRVCANSIINFVYDNSTYSNINNIIYLLLKININLLGTRSLIALMRSSSSPFLKFCKEESVLDIWKQCYDRSCSRLIELDKDPDVIFVGLDFLYNNRKQYISDLAT